MSVRVIGMVAVVSFGLLLIVGSAAKKPEPVKPPTFEFTPPTNAGPNSANVTLALVNAHYSQNETWTNVAPFNSFSESLDGDFQELLSARGFTVRGPFAEYQEMTFPDKKGSDLILQPNLDVTIESTPKVVPEILGKQLEADLVVRGRVNLDVRESLTGEQMWRKSIELKPPETVHCEGKFYASDAAIPTSDGTAAAMLANPECARLVVPIMERFYLKVMDTSWKYLEPEEMVVVKKQSQEIKTKKVY